MCPKEERRIKEAKKPEAVPAVTLKAGVHSGVHGLGLQTLLHPPRRTSPFLLKHSEAATVREAQGT